MIVVKVDNGQIHLTGHAHYSMRGQDVVCAGMTALTQSLVESIRQLTDKNLVFEACPGEVHIETGDLSKQSKLLIDSFLIGVRLIEEEFPDNVRIMSRRGGQ